MSLTEKLGLTLGVYAAVMAAVAWKFRLPVAFNRARSNTGDPYYD
jgi:hypothetical protein